jgi:2-dehydropantoate 2-reductase
MKIAIIGTGGVGGYLGGKLAKAGFDVTFLARGEHLKAIQRNGLIIKSIQGDIKVDPAKATDRIDTIGLADLVILAVKAWQVRDISKDLSSITRRDTVVLPLQNGVLAVDELRDNIKEENLIGGLCRIISKIESPGVINHSGLEPSLMFGELNNVKTDRTNQIKAVFDKAGIDSKVSDDITSDIWKKFIGICVSGLLAVTKTTYGELRELQETRQLMIELLLEIYVLSQQMGIHMESVVVPETVSMIDSYPYGSTSSLTKDVWEGKPSEIEYQNGTVVRLGQKYGVDTPVNRFVYACILPMELKARKSRAELNVQEWENTKPGGSEFL